MLAALQAFFQDRHTLNLISILIGIFAGLYGFYELLGRPGGILRQLLVAFPAGVTGALSLFIFDNLTHQLYSHTLQSALGFPVTTTVLLLVGFFPSFLIPIASPNTYRRGDSAHKYTFSTLETIVLVLFTTVSGVFGFLVALAAILARLNPLHLHPSLPVVVGLAIVCSLCLAATGVWGLRQQARGNDDDSTTNIPTAGCVGLIIATLVWFSVSVLSLIAFILLFGWGILLYSLVSGVAVQLLYGVQYLVDRMKARQLGYLALALFAVAAAIQLYLAL
ncbi:MAG TPA: hypothetical protein VKQ36_08710 [Ktedonobacterales bacterium]|nr:hypothetical protein [Ktedonobacterales bacterium]